MSYRLPLPGDKIYAPFKIAALVEILEAQGISPANSLQGTGIKPDQVHNAYVRISVRQYARVCVNALQLSADPRTSFLVGSKLHLFAYGMYGYALMSCPSLRDYFVLGVKYHLLAAPTLKIRWEERSDTAVWLFPDEFTFASSPELRRFLIEQQFMQHVTHLQDVAGRKAFPVQACFSYPAPDHASIYSEHLGCPCYFDQPICELHYSNQILGYKPVLSHDLSANLLRDTCDDLVCKAVTSTGLGEEVYQLLIRAPGRFMNMEDVANKFHMTSRTLRRRLAEEGLSFSEILDDARRTLSIEHLRSTHLRIDDICSLVGFSDVSNFRKAFKRWTGDSPRNLRRHAS
ncbi:AraC family transcriptional regulator [Halomonas sp. HP20-15]|uniref:AraC family transcriptional regulator n=1 Tax=Halomonas sp. HP20-15 TaxID=3085901 RepID=UPI0029818362|nr:AraC family transcriptional regulator [Halomonas sp. HP20-15]MDW5376570.1 AraC family transcriptional regulator [Halomonas sp. HP20-15]